MPRLEIEKRAALELLELQLAVAGALGEVLHLVGDLRQALLVGVP